MLIYWLLLAYPAVMALAYTAQRRSWLTAGQAIGFCAFIIFYTFISLIREQIGADWPAYLEMQRIVGRQSLMDALSQGDFLFSLILWISYQLGWGIYPANAIASFLLCYGVVRVALDMRDPWLGIVIAVPYILIVVGFGYIRQAAAIGLMLMAIASLRDGKTRLMMTQLLLGLLFHSTSIATWPFFALCIARRNKFGVVALTIIGAVAVITFFSDRFSSFEANYVDANYESSGAFVRILLNTVFALPVLAKWRSFESSPIVRPLWLGFALANLAALLALAFVPSTAVDRLALYLSPIQVFTAANIVSLSPLSRRNVLFPRMLVIGAAIAVQIVWLVFADHAQYWVPYRSVLEYL